MRRSSQRGFAMFLFVSLSALLLLLYISYFERSERVNNAILLSLASETTSFSCFEIKEAFKALIKEELTNGLNFSLTSDELRKRLAERAVQLLYEISSKLHCEVFIKTPTSKAPLTSKKLAELSRVELIKVKNFRIARYVFTGGITKNETLVFLCRKINVTSLEEITSGFSVEVVGVEFA